MVRIVAAFFVERRDMLAWVPAINSWIRTFWGERRNAVSSWVGLFAFLIRAPPRVARGFIMMG